MKFINVKLCLDYINNQISIIEKQTTPKLSDLKQQPFYLLTILS